MWSHQLIGLLLILSLPACLAAQTLYKCRTPEGRLVMSDTPCPGESATTVIESEGETHRQPAGPAGKAASPSKVGRDTRPLLREDLEPPVPRQACLTINDVATNVSDHGRYSKDLTWKVQVSNRCPQPLRITVTFALYDRDQFAIRSARKGLHVPARESAAAQGRMLLRLGEFQRVSEKQATLQ